MTFPRPSHVPNTGCGHTGRMCSGVCETREHCESVGVPSGAVVRVVPVLFARDSSRTCVAVRGPIPRPTLGVVPPTHGWKSIGCLQISWTTSSASIRTATGMRSRSSRYAAAGCFSRRALRLIGSATRRRCSSLPAGSGLMPGTPYSPRRARLHVVRRLVFGPLGS
jgi:hypothetical protein